MTTSVTNFLETTAYTGGALSPEHATQLLELAEKGDTSTTLESGGVPATTDALEANNADGTKTDDANLSANQDPATKEAPKPANPVLLAKDGVHTISYDKLVEARQQAATFKAQAETATQELNALKAEAQARVDAGEAPTKTDNMVAAASAAIEAGADVDLFGDFSEEDIAKGINALVEQRVQAHVQTAVGKALAPLHEQQQETANQAHFGAILEKHPDAFSIAESAELNAWIKAGPSYAQAGMRNVLANGSAEQVIELFDNFKKSTGSQPAATSGKSDSQTTAAAKAAIAAAVQAVPSSLSDIPGGRADGQSPQERLAAMSAPDMSEAMLKMTPDQIEAFLNRNL